MHVVAAYSVDDILLPMMEGLRSTVLPDGRRVKLTSDRLRLFFLKGITCCCCGVEGNEFRLESHTTETPHLNLYAVQEDGKVILMTKDHIHPKSLGGANHMDNYQTMCQPCNGKKAATVETPEEKVLVSA